MSHLQGNSRPPLRTSAGAMQGAVEAAIAFVSLLSLVASVHCYGVRWHDPLGELIINQRMGNQATQDGSVKHLAINVASQEGSKEADRISKLPGQPDVKFCQYSGYVTVDPHAGRALFYWLTESENAAKDPLVLWLSGGPGCSSIGNGGMNELGPFRVNPDGKTLWHNKYAWNTVANMLFLDSPAGVGYSYSNTSSDYVTGDNRTAADTLTYLINWLDRFPEYKHRDFYITGESYAGHYVPQLAQLILKNNNDPTSRTIINLKGIAIGNPYIDFQDTLSGIYDYYWSHALISDDHHAAILKDCNFSTRASVTEQCEEAIATADEDMGNVFIYDIYEPLCGSNSTAPTISTYDPCTGNYTVAYLNKPEVQKAFHANATGIPGPWDLCSKFLVAWNDKPETVLPVIKELMASNINVWIYSGDTDGRVPVTATGYSMEKLEAPVKTPWYPWYHQGEVGGYVVEYQNLTFLSVRGAGHFVASYQPGRALAVFSAFLSGKLPPGQQAS